MFCSPLHYGNLSLCLSRASGISTCTHRILSSHEIYWKELGSSFTPPFQAFTQVGKITWAFSSPGKRDNPSSLNFSLSVRCSNHLITFVALNWIHSFMPISVLDWGAQNCTQHLSCSSWGLNRVKESPPLLAVLFPVYTRRLLGFFAARARGGSWLAIVLCKAALQLVSPPVCTGGGGYSLQCRTLHFSLLNFMRLLFAHFFSLLRSLWMVEVNEWGVWSVHPLGC